MGVVRGEFVGRSSLDSVRFVSCSVRDRFLSRLKCDQCVSIGSFVAGPGFEEVVTCMSSVTNFEGGFNDWLIGGDHWRC